MPACWLTHLMHVCILYINGPVLFLSTMLLCTHIQHTLTHKETCTCIVFDLHVATQRNKDSIYHTNWNFVLHCVTLNMHYITACVCMCAINAQRINPMGHYMQIQACTCVWEEFVFVQRTS